MQKIILKQRRKFLIFLIKKTHAILLMHGAMKIQMGWFRKLWNLTCLMKTVNCVSPIHCISNPDGPRIHGMFLMKKKNSAITKKQSTWQASVIITMKMMRQQHLKNTMQIIWVSLEFCRKQKEILLLMSWILKVFWNQNRNTMKLIVKCLSWILKQPLS